MLSICLLGLGVNCYRWYPVLWSIQQNPFFHMIRLAIHKLLKNSNWFSLTEPQCKLWFLTMLHIKMNMTQISKSPNTVSRKKWGMVKITCSTKTFFLAEWQRRTLKQQTVSIEKRQLKPKDGWVLSVNCGFILQDLSQLTEEVHEVIVLQLQEHNNPRKHTTPEQSTLLQDFGLVIVEEEDDEEGVTDLGSIKNCCYPNPSYRGQMLHLPESIHMTEILFKENDTESTYKNGLFFETRLLESDETTL